MFLYRCASCGSDRVQLRSVNEGFSYSKALAGAVVFGTAGAVAGLAGKKTTKYYCPRCGQTLDYPMDANQAFDIDKELIYRNDPAHYEILRIKKKIYPGIDWQDPEDRNGGVQIVKERAAINPNASTEALLQRIDDFIEDSDWDNAAYYCEYLLDKEPTNAEVYQKKILIENQASDIYELGFKLDATLSSLEGSTYNKFIKYGGEEAQNWCDEVTSISREYLHRRIEARKKEKYDNLIKGVVYHASISDLKSIAAELQKLAPYEEADSNIEKCNDYITKKKAEADQKVIDDRKNEVADAFESMKNAGTIEKAGEYLNAIKSIGTEEEISRAETEFTAIQKIIEDRNKSEKKRQFITIGVIAAAAVIIFLLYTWVFTPLKLQKQYNHALKYEEEGNYVEAINIYRELNGYKDCNSRIQQATIESKYQEGLKKLSAEPTGKNYKNYITAKNRFESIIDYKDSAELFNKAEQLEYESLKMTPFDDGSKYYLDMIYKDIMDMHDENLKNELLKLPQMQAIIMLEGQWYETYSSGEKGLDEVFVHDGKYDGDPIIYISGKYYISYFDKDNYHEIFNISKDKHNDRYHWDDYSDIGNFVR